MSLVLWPIVRLSVDLIKGVELSDVSLSDTSEVSIDEAPPRGLVRVRSAQNHSRGSSWLSIATIVINFLIYCL